MKQIFMVLCLASCGLIACDDDDDNGPSGQTGSICELYLRCQSGGDNGGGNGTGGGSDMGGGSSSGVDMGGGSSSGDDDDDDDDMGGWFKQVAGAGAGMGSGSGSGSGSGGGADAGTGGQSSEAMQQCVDFVNGKLNEMDSCKSTGSSLVQCVARTNDCDAVNEALDALQTMSRVPNIPACSSESNALAECVGGQGSGGDDDDDDDDDDEGGF